MVWSGEQAGWEALWVLEEKREMYYWIKIHDETHNCRLSTECNSSRRLSWVVCGYVCHMRQCVACVWVLRFGLAPVGPGSLSSSTQGSVCVWVWDRVGSLISQTCVLLLVALPAYAHSRIPSIYSQLIMRGPWACQAFSKLERKRKRRKDQEVSAERRNWKW